MDAKNNPVLRAAAVVGGQTALAERLGIIKQQVNGWVKRGWVPPEYATRIARLTGVPRSELCPRIEWDMTDAGSAPVVAVE